MTFSKGKAAYASKAEKLAAEFGNDGTVFRKGDQHIEEVAIWRGARHHQHGNAHRYLFSDGSAIVVVGSGWDLEGDRPFSWRGVPGSGV